MKKKLSIGIVIELSGFGVLSDLVMPLAGKVINVQGKYIE